jgi:Rne/Rng family ribonuclease
VANELIINASLPETRIALMEDGEIQELLIERASGKGIVGNIYKGRVTRVLPGMQAAFVDIGLEKAAFLYVDDVYVHSEIWEEDEEESDQASVVMSEVASETDVKSEGVEAKLLPSITSNEVEAQKADIAISEADEAAEWQGEAGISRDDDSDEGEELEDEDEDDLDDESDKPTEMGAGPDDGDSDDRSGNSSEQPHGTLAPESKPARGQRKNQASQAREAVSQDSESQDAQSEGSDSQNDSGDNESSEASGEQSAEGGEQGEDKEGTGTGRRRHRRGRRGGRFRRKGAPAEAAVVAVAGPQIQPKYPENYHEQVADSGTLDSDRSGLAEDQRAQAESTEDNSNINRPENAPREANSERRPAPVGDRPEFRAPRSRDRRIRQKTSSRPVRAQVNIQDLLKEGQEVLVQVAKDPIATKGARLTCHISLPGRHLVCMPTIDHVGVSRRIERDEERRRLREYVERNRPKGLGFIVRTASGKQQSEKRIKQDIEYLTRLWTEIREKAASVTAPSLVYEDLNSVLRAIRDWVTEEIDKVIVDSRYHFNEIQRFVSHFMPSLKQKVELYHGDVPIFDAYGISTELSRALERKVWLKSGGYIVVDQAEALVAIDVNTGRYVGKKNLEDTILKTNLEAVHEIAYQLRLRNCGGIIILDLIDMEKDENKHRVYRALAEALSRDRARPTILKISELGLVEMTRKRTRDTIVRTLCESCTHCEGKGFIKGKQTVAYEVMREIEREGIEREVSKILVQAHPDVIDILAIDERDSLDQLEKRYRKQIYLQAVTDFHPEQFEVTADKKERAERSKDHNSHREHREHQQNERSHDQNQERGRHRERQPRHENNNNSQPPVAVDPSAPPIAKLGIVATAAPLPVANTLTPEGLPVEKVSGSPIIIAPASMPTPVAAAPAHGIDGFDEEDRLAFLRAQAAQDAALARLGSGSSGQPIRNAGEGAGRNDRGGAGRRPVRGRRGPAGSGSGSGGTGGGGKFGRGSNRNQNRTPSGPKPFGYGPSAKRNEPSMKDAAAAPSDAAPAAATTPAGGGEGSGNGGNNGPGDHSQPPA